jgi:hypothetical protein
LHGLGRVAGWHMDLRATIESESWPGGGPQRDQSR